MYTVGGFAKVKAAIHKLTGEKVRILVVYPSWLFPPFLIKQNTAVYALVLLTSLTQFSHTNEHFHSMCML